MKKMQIGLHIESRSDTNYIIATNRSLKKLSTHEKMN